MDTVSDSTVEIDNRAVKHLIDNGFFSLEKTVEFSPRTRDRDDVGVLRCLETGLIFLQSSRHIDEKYYETKRDEDPVARRTRSDRVKDRDTERRIKSHAGLIQDARWLDIGSGECRVLRAAAEIAEIAIGLEPTAWRPGKEEDSKFRVIQDLEELGSERMDVISLFHVLEHVTDPVLMLRGLAERLAADGRMIIEVPHARDALLVRYQCAAYRDHTLWSEHLVLHTVESLAATIEQAGLRVEEMSGCQRYPLANHLYWLSEGKAGGQEAWQDLASEQLDAAYEAMLIATGQTDTLTAIVCAS